jgi:hypothetical protein
MTCPAFLHHAIMRSWHLCTMTSSRHWSATTGTSGPACGRFPGQAQGAMGRSTWCRTWSLSACLLCCINSRLSPCLWTLSTQLSRLKVCIKAVAMHAQLPAGVGLAQVALWYRHRAWPPPPPPTFHLMRNHFFLPTVYCRRSTSSTTAQGCSDHSCVAVAQLAWRICNNIAYAHAGVIGGSKRKQLDARLSLSHTSGPTAGQLCQLWSSHADGESQVKGKCLGLGR